MNIYKIENLSFRYRKNQNYILKNISFEIEEGGFYLICGKSGSGKTTLLQLLKKEIMPQGDITGNIFIIISKDVLVLSKIAVFIISILLFDKQYKIPIIIKQPHILFTINY